MFVAFSPFDNFSLVILDFRSNSSMLKFVRVEYLFASFKAIVWMSMTTEGLISKRI